MSLNPTINGSKESLSEKVGLVHWFGINQHEEVEKALIDFKKLGIRHIRTNVSWADWYCEGGRQWYDWLFEKLGRELSIVPCIVHTPTAFGIKPKVSAPPVNPKLYADFVNEIITTYGQYFEYVELWNEPNNVAEYDFTLDNDWHIFSEMICAAAKVCGQRGKKTILGGMNPIDPNWLELLFRKKVMLHINVVGIHAFPDVFDHNCEDWEAEMSKIQEVLKKNQSTAEIWITEASVSTWQKGESKQLQEFIHLISTNTTKIYWNGLKDKAVNDSYTDNLKSYIGIKNADDSPKLLYTLWESKGLGALKSFKWMCTPVTNTKEKYTLITGGAGFVGTNLADRILSEGKSVMVFDNLSRAGVQNNLFWLKEKHGDKLRVLIADIRNKAAVQNAVQGADMVFHFAAQVAVTSSLVNPFHDFEVNAQGTLNLLEAVRNSNHQPPVIFTSTNKVYGELPDINMIMNGTRYHPENVHIRKNGISEERNLDFHSPYGCSKGVADQYIIDYGRTFGLKTAVFRMSCIYGPHQFGTEDQGWVAHFLIQSLKNKEITLYGDGKQVRDILFVEDLVNAFMLAQENIDAISCQAFNIGGGVPNTVSLLELLDMISDLNGGKPMISFNDWRPGDQKYYVSDFKKFTAATGWAPKVGTAEGVGRLYDWLVQNAEVPQRRKEKKVIHKQANKINKETLIK